MAPFTPITCMGDEKLPPRSPDLTPLDYYLWGYVKSKVYEFPKATDVKGLKERIDHCLKEIPIEMLHSSLLNFKTCLQKTIDNDGSHIELKL
jgi:hypothetical protein